MGDEKKPGLTVTLIGTGRANAEVINLLTGMMGSRKYLAAADPITAAPALPGAHGQAWMVDLETGRRVLIGGREDATCCMWVVEAQFAHPLWHSYLFAMIHLRPVDGLPPPLLYRPDATHEFWIFAMDPEKPRQPVIEGAAMPSMLHPKNFGAQLVAGTDAEAMQLVEAAVQDVVDGKISPDTDWFSVWVERFGDAMVKPEYRR